MQSETSCDAAPCHRQTDIRAGFIAPNDGRNEAGELPDGTKLKYDEPSTPSSIPKPWRSRASEAPKSVGRKTIISEGKGKIKPIKAVTGVDAANVVAFCPHREETMLDACVL
jgi:hypothetical protein